MKCILPVFGLVAGALAWSNNTVVWTTITTDIYTTYCPESTTFTQGTVTYTATASETLTITKCPCTIVKPLSSVVPSSTYVPPVNSTSIFVTTTETVSSYTTYCPVPTTVVQGNQTYTITSATTLTVTNCPCSLTKTYPASLTTITLSSLTTFCPAPTTITYSSATYPVTTSGTVTLPVVTVSTVPITTATPVSVSPVSSGLVTSVAATNTPKPVTSTASSPLPAQISGAAAHNGQSGVGALALAGLAAMIL